MPSIYQTINQRADAIKAHKWQCYTPLSSFQLSDYDAQADDDNEDITIIAMTANQNPDRRSTRRSAVRYKQFKIIKRPTELLAIRNANCPPDEAPVIRIESEETRWCIICADRHPIDAFMTHRRYLHGLSYACRDKLLAGWHGRRWRISA